MKPWVKRERYQDLKREKQLDKDKTVELAEETVDIALKKLKKTKLFKETRKSLK